MIHGSGTLVPQNNREDKGEAEASLPIFKHLPHIDMEGYYQFITFRTYDSIDAYIRKINLTDLSNKQKQHKIDEYLDSSLNGAYLDDEVLKYLYDFLKSKDGVLYDLVAFAIMSNHIHLLIKPLEKLPLVMQKIKGASAKVINEMLFRNGKFWTSDYYDKAIRDEKHFHIVYEYIKNNPLKLGEAKASLPRGYNRFYGKYE